MSIIDTAREHPGMAVGVGVIAVVAVVYFMSSGGGGTAIQSAPAGAVDSGTSFNDQLAASQQHSQDLNASLQASAMHDTTSLEMAKLSLQAFNANEQTKQFEIENATAVAMQASTLNAQVQTANINSQIRGAEIASNQAISLQQSQAHSQEVLVNSLVKTQMAGIQANQAIATQSWWDKLFG